MKELYTNLDYYNELTLTCVKVYTRCAVGWNDMTSVLSKQLYKDKRSLLPLSIVKLTQNVLWGMYLHIIEILNLRHQFITRVIRQASRTYKTNAERRHFYCTSLTFVVTGTINLWRELVYSWFQLCIQRSL